jgi:hypothetical protein
MRKIEVVGQVDENQQLRAELPADVPPGPVRVIVGVPEDGDEEMSRAWEQAISQAWADDWSDPCEDIYTLEDGEPYHRPKPS